MAKPELGLKRVCQSCGAKFYDLSKDPIVCPKCGTVYEQVITTAALRRGAPVAAKEADEVELATPDAEFVSLEDADAEASGGAKAVPIEDDIEIDDDVIDDDDDTFLAEDEDEDDDDVSDIIGDGLEDEEEP